MVSDIFLRATSGRIAYSRSLSFCGLGPIALIVSRGLLLFLDDISVDDISVDDISVDDVSVDDVL